MPTHDCSICEAAGKCPIESIAPWLNEHEAEVDQAMVKEHSRLVNLCTSVTLHNPILFICASDLAESVCLALIIGYHAGRTFQDVPEVFKNA